MFERAAQVNARFAANACRPQDVVEALEGVGITRSQINVLTRAAAPPPPGPTGMLERLLARFKTAAPASVAPEPDWQVTVHLGQNPALSGPAQDVFRRFGAASIEDFAASQSANRAFGPGVGRDKADGA